MYVCEDYTYLGGLFHPEGFPMQNNAFIRPSGPLSSAGQGPGTFSTLVKYDASFHGGSQEGILALYHQGGAESDFGVVMLKVLVEA